MAQPGDLLLTTFKPSFPELRQELQALLQELVFFAKLRPNLLAFRSPRRRLAADPDLARFQSPLLQSNSFRPPPQIEFTRLQASSAREQVLLLLLQVEPERLQIGCNLNPVLLPSMAGQGKPFELLRQVQALIGQFSG